MSLIDITERTVMTVEGQIEAAYTILAMERRGEIELAWAVRAVNIAEEEDMLAFTAFMEILGLPLPYEQQEEPANFQMVKPLRRPSHKARSMTRTGSRSHKVRKDHGTKARRVEISAENANRRSQQKNSVRAQRRFAKLASSCNNRHTVARAKLELLGKR